MKYYGSIYLIRNTHNGKIYIGQTTEINPYSRVNKHLQGSGNFFIKRLINSYGKDCLETELLYTSFDQQDLNNKEYLFITSFNSIYPNGYNLKLGGDAGGKCADETKLRISESKKGRPNHNLKGRRFTKSHKENLSKVRKGFTSENRRVAARKNGDKLSKKIIAENINSGEVILFNSMTECAKVLNLQVENVGRVINSKQGRRQHKGWKFKLQET